MMLSLGQAQVPGLRNINHVHYLRQVDKKAMSGWQKRPWLACWNMYLRWNDERVFQSIWEKEDGSALVFFSNVIQDIQAYVHNWMT